MSAKWLHYINGQLVAPASGTWINAFDPRSGEVAAEVAAGGASEVGQAVAAAAAAAPAWRALRPSERGRIMQAIARKIRENLQRLADIEVLETGKPAGITPYEIDIAAQYFEFYGGLTNLFHGEVIGLGSGYHSYTSREPFGVVGVITPWNGPLNQAARAIAPALAAGNTVVIKPSEFTSGTTVALAKMACEECGLPPGVLNVVLGTGEVCGAAVVAHPQVRKVAFTGSVRAGREVGRIAAERIIPLTLELGGKSPNIIFDDADLGAAVSGAVRAFVINAGQVCTAGTRLLVQASIHDEVVEKLAAAVRGLKVGPQPDATVGPLTTHAGLERVASYFEIAKAEGAHAVVGGGPARQEGWADGWFVAPTIYTGVTADMRIAREEIFGPVLVVMPFVDEAEAIRMANDTDYGLASYVYTQNLSRAWRVVEALRFGMVGVNDINPTSAAAPFGGVKQSGQGREGAHEGIFEYLDTKLVGFSV